MNPFDCHHCRHRVSAHTTTAWPHFTKRCRHCDCPGYQPTYKTAVDHER